MSVTGALVMRLGSPVAVVAAPAEDDLVQRRAIRGAPVEGVHESDELRSMREFDESSFPRPLPVGDLLDVAPDDRGALHPSADLHPAQGGLGPDALPASLRSPVPQPETVPTSIPWLSSLKLPDMPVRLDPRVVRYLEFYKTDPKGRSIMTSWLRRQGRYRALMETAMEQAHLPKALLYVSMIESSYDPHDRSHVGAVGLWQFLPEGARIYGLRVDHWVDERKDPEKATLAAMRYLGDLKARFGTWSLALAAFNAGYGAVLRSIHKYNSNDYFADNPTRQQARMLCHGCPVQAECLNQALETDSRYGVWGGINETDRRLMHDQWARTHSPTPTFEKGMCEADGCDHWAAARGHCWTHLKRIYRTGTAAERAS